MWSEKTARSEMAGRSEISGGKYKKGLLAAAALFVVLLSAELAVTIIGEQKAVWRPGYEMQDIATAVDWEHVAVGEALKPSDYSMLMEQTGLGRCAVDRVISVAAAEVGAKREVDAKTGGAGEAGMGAENGLTAEGRLTVERLEAFQSDFFREGYSTCEKIGLFTYEERFRRGGERYGENSSGGDYVAGFAFADIRDGDILIGNNTHSFGWRHGHAAIVVDASEGITLEAVLWGRPSRLQNLTKWRSYPRVAVLRISTETAEKIGCSQSEAGTMAAAYALKYGVGVDYKLLAGLGEKAPKELTATQCAHLVWSAYKVIGLDIDSDGGWLVTPHDIINSDCLELVQLYGMNPHKPW